MKQGNPISPYIFLSAMEFFSMLFDKRADEGMFEYHPNCKEFRISHLIFTDELFNLAKLTAASINAINKVINEFGTISGLRPNLQKSDLFIADVSHKQQNSKLVSCICICICHLAPSSKISWGPSHYLSALS